jgi:hypothetical protein
MASVPPSGFTLTGLVQHLAEVERNWFRRVFAGERRTLAPALATGPAGERRGLPWLIFRWSRC